MPITNPLTTATAEGTPRKPATLAEQGTIGALALALAQVVSPVADGLFPGLGNVAELIIVAAVPILAALIRNALGDTLAGLLVGVTVPRAPLLLIALLGASPFTTGCALLWPLPDASPRSQYQQAVSWYYVAQGVVISNQSELTYDQVQAIALADRRVSLARKLAHSCALTQPAVLPEAATCFADDGSAVPGVRVLDDRSDPRAVLDLTRAVVQAARDITAFAAGDDDRALIASREPRFAAGLQ